MKKRVLALIMSTAMIASVLTACGGSDETTKTEDKTTTEKTENKDAASDSSSTTDVSAATGEIKVWVAENMVSLTQEKADAFKAANPDYAGFTVTIEPVGEGDAAGNMITDVEGGADIYGFAQDQIARLVSAGALMPLSGDNATFVTEKNDAGAAAAATVGDTVYAFPITSDNGYFLYYDKSVVSDASTLEQVIADCEAAGKGFYMEINGGWYQPAFFFATGCELTYDTDNDGNFIGCNVSYASDAGVKALKKMVEVAKSPAFNNGSNISNAANVAAIVDGTWDATAAKGLFGDNYACAKLPTFTVDGETFQMSGFGGFKLLGVKPQTDAAKLQACLALAKYLADEEVQLARFEAEGWGPSNLVAQQNEAVLADEALSALAEQLAFTIPQGNYPGDYWTLATSLGDSVIAGDYDNASDADLMAVLENFQASCKSYAGQ